MDRRGLLAGDVGVGGVDQVDRDPQVAPLAERAPDRFPRVPMARADVQRDPVSADRVGRQQRAVEHQVRPEPEEGPILGAQRLAFRAVGHDDRPAAGLPGNRSPLAPDREAGAAATEQAARLEGGDDGRRGGAERHPAQPGEVLGVRFGSCRGRWAGEQARVHHRFLQAGSTATGSAVPPVTAASRLRFVPPDVRR